MPTYTLAAAVEVEAEIRKSRFIGIVMPVDSRDAAQAELERLRAQHRAATHVCWALMAGGQSGMSDDGEPSGTAGRPMLEVLRHHELDGVLAAVVRYYGGIKLGSGGLVRAYTDAVASALKQAQRIERIAWAEVEIAIAYADESHLRYWLQQKHYTLVGSSHDTLARLHVRLPAADLDQLKDALPRLALNASIRQIM
ncbi:IMPACT family protein [Herbaspirillum rhizosphaerae]|uniref:IMPACT family protein n=1 Tax=Herbaspirillum rhizosphaerae TaxID=346179 RepID=UPI00067E0CB9|nr:YigZ family protein [Herbaspirillum rhizosphaerae]